MAYLVPTIIEYLDYRLWLQDLYKTNKERSRTFSHRYLTQKLKLNSPGYMLQIMQGRKALSDTLSRRIAKLFKLSKRDTEYLLALVAYERTESQEKRAQLFEQIARMRRYSYRRLEPGQFLYFEKWYHLAIRELVAVAPFKGDYARLARQLRPPISPAEAEEAIKLLGDVGVIYQDHQGVYRRREPVVGTGDTWASETIANLQVQLANLGREALGTFEKKDRDISSVTLSVSRDTFETMKRRLGELRREFLDMATRDRNPDMVLQCNLQLFPLADPGREKGEK